MDFSLEYDKEQEIFAKEVREWLDKNVPKDLTTPRDTRKMPREHYQKLRDIARKLGEKGWLYPGYPRQYGGGGLDANHTFVIAQEMGKRHLGLPPHYDSNRLAAPTVLSVGTEEQKERLLPPMLKGEVTSWQLFTEPEAGTDEANQQTNALRSVREKDYFIVNGQKIFVGGLYAPPDYFLLLTRSDPQAPRHENLSMFLAPADSPGVTIVPLDLFPSGTFSQIAPRAPDGAPGVKHQVFLDDVKVHESYLIGEEGDGWRVTNATLEVEHGDSTGSGGSGRAGQEITKNWVVDRFLEQCKSNPGVAKRLSENPELLHNLVDIHIGAEIERLFSLRNTWLTINKKRVLYAGPQLAVYTKIFAGRCIADMAKVLGPFAFTDDNEWGLEEDLFEVAERCGLCFAPGGTPEALKIGISRALRIGR